MAYVSFVKSKTLAQALQDSASNPGKIYFPSDNSNGIVMGGKVYGVNSNTPNTSFWSGTEEDYQAEVTSEIPGCLYFIHEDSVKNYNYIDLGLPSGTLWMDRNLGVTDLYGFGKYFQWGDTVGYGEDRAMDFSTWSTAPLNGGNSSYSSSSFSSVRNNAISGNDLTVSFDAAYQYTNGDAVMPTSTQISELLSGTTSSIVQNYNGSGVNGCLFTGSNGKSIFIPLSGKYYNGSNSSKNIVGSIWSRTLYSSDAQKAYYLNIDSSNSLKDLSNSESRYYARSIRGVKNK